MLNRPEDIELKAICLKRFSTDAFFAYGNNGAKAKMKENYFNVKGFESTIINLDNAGKDEEEANDLEDLKNLLLHGGKKPKYFNVGGTVGGGIGTTTGPSGRLRDRGFIRTGNK